MRFLTDLTLRRAIGGIVCIAVVFTFASAALMRLVEPRTYDTYGGGVLVGGADRCRRWATATTSRSPAGRLLATS